MNKRRKYDGKNKRSFIIILILSVLVVVIFSLFIYNYTKIAKIEYKIESGSVLQDVDKNYMTIDDDAVLKIRWNGNYYLNYNKEKIALGKKLISYNTITGGMKLYGNFYEIASDGKVIEHKNETVLENLTETKFYKIDDREYLLTASKIFSEDYSIEASNYLLVELDKGGNAKLSNNKINLKTISPTTLVTDKYTFDINNEILNFGSYDIDLKKIIGSTNQYVEEKPEEEGDNASTGEDDNVGNVVGDGGGTGSDDVINTYPNTGPTTDIEDLINKVKMTSVIRIAEGLTSVEIDYVVYDPYNEYGAVYIEVISNDKLETVYLSKNDTHIVLDKLEAATDYKLNFVYTTRTINLETGEEDFVPHTFDQYNIRTKTPEYIISVYKISTVNNTLTYKVNLQSGYSINAVNTKMSFDYMAKDPETGVESLQTVNVDGVLDVSGATSNNVLGSFDISNYNIQADTILRLTVKSIVVGEREIPINSTYLIRVGR